jgi:hypothetical protein
MYRPWMNRKFGVELEMNDVTVENVNLTSREVRDAVVRGVRLAGQQDNRVSARGAGYFHSDGGTWDVKTDGSCGYLSSHGWEVASPAMFIDENGECDELKQVCEALKGLRPRIDRSCGLHVSVDTPDYTWQDLRNLIVLWVRYEPFVFEMCPPSRRANLYCPAWRRSVWTGSDSYEWRNVQRLIEARTEAVFRQHAVDTPRGSLNVAHWFRNRRIEFRLGAGTVQYEKVIRFAQFLVSFVTRVKQGQMPLIQSGGYSDRPFNTTYVFKMLGLAPSRFVPAADVPEASHRLFAWVEQRRQQFQPAGSDAIETAISAAAYGSETRRASRAGRF